MGMLAVNLIVFWPFVMKENDDFILNNGIGIILFYFFIQISWGYGLEAPFINSLTEVKKRLDNELNTITLSFYLLQVSGKATHLWEFLPGFS